LFLCSGHYVAFRAVISVHLRSSAVPKLLLRSSAVPVPQRTARQRQESADAQITQMTENSAKERHGNGTNPQVKQMTWAAADDRR
jgi:hypothetical protein